MSQQEPMSFKKKLENYWFYYKIHTIIGAFVLFLLVVTLVQCANQVEPDLCAAYVSSVPTSADNAELLFENLIGDANGDGNVDVLLENITIPENPATEADFYMAQKLMLTFVGGSTRLYIMDKMYFEQETYAEMFQPLEDVVPQEALKGGFEYGGEIVAVPVNNSAKLSSIGIQGDNLYVGVVRVTESNKSKDGNELLFETSKKLIAELMQ